MNKGNYRIFATIIIGLTLINCYQPDQIRSIGVNGNLLIQANDKAELTEFIRKVYKWHETESSQNDFNPKVSESQDTMYVGLDWVAHAERIIELEATFFFSKEFFDNYNKIARTIDEELKNGSKEWLAGDMSPYGNNANPWCNCQDYPDRYWELLTVVNIKNEKDYTAFQWTWGNDFFYDVKVVKSGNLWKIKYLQGLDYSNYINSDTFEPVDN